MPVVWSDPHPKAESDLGCKTNIYFFCQETKKFNAVFPSTLTSSCIRSVEIGWHA